jgi:hypothetical protein
MERLVLTDAPWAKMAPHCLGKPSHPGHSEAATTGACEKAQAIIAGKQRENGDVLGFVCKWRARRDSNSRPLDS